MRYFRQNLLPRIFALFHSKVNRATTILKYGPDSNCSLPAEQPNLPHMTVILPFNTVQNLQPICLVWIDGYFECTPPRHGDVDNRAEQQE